MPSLPIPPISPKKTRSNKPKIFQCTGFGDCHMVFSRSEHLARHTRKHTGEKPYLCIVPGCTRKFSRFDNMMQHTQTHKTRSYNTNKPTTKLIKETTPESMTDASSDDDMPVSLNKGPVLKELYLTQDEFEALQGLGQFRHTPIFIDSFRDFASAVYITPNPPIIQQQQSSQ